MFEDSRSIYFIYWNWEKQWHNTCCFKMNSFGYMKVNNTSRQLFGGLQIISQFLTQCRCTPQPLHWYNTIYCLEFFNNWSSNDKAMIASFASWYLTRVSPWNLKEIGIQLNWTYQQRGQSLLTNAQKFVLVTTASVAWVVLFLMIVW